MTFEHYYVDIPIPALFLELVIVVTGIWTQRFGHYAEDLRALVA